MFPYHTQIIAPYATMPLLTEVQSSKRVTDRPTDNPTDATASKNEKNCRMLEIHVQPTTAKLVTHHFMF